MSKTHACPVAMAYPTHTGYIDVLLSNGSQLREDNFACAMHTKARHAEFLHEYRLANVSRG